MPRCHRYVTFAAVLTFLPLTGSSLSAQGAERLPSAVLHDIAKWRLAHLSAKPTEVEAELTPLLEHIRTTGLSAEEEMALGLSYFYTFDGLRAKPIFEKYMWRDDMLGRASWMGLQNMTFAGAKDYPLFTKRLADYRTKFAPIAGELGYTGGMVRNLARNSAQAGDDAAVVKLIMDDVQALPMDVPFAGYENIARYFESFRKTDRAADAITLMKRHRDAMRARVSNTPAAAAGIPATPAASLELPHREGVLHLFPFQDWLFNDSPNYTESQAIVSVTTLAVQRFTEWIEAAEAGKPLLPS